MIAQLSEELVWGQIVARAWCDEELIPDPRGALTPAEIVEHKLTALLSHCGQGMSHILVGRRSSRDH
jgi:hypothetical protein